MKRKILQHQTNTICDMFVGWQLLEDYHVLTELQTGTLLVNLVDQKCEFNGKLIKSLFMLSMLRKWLEEDFQRHHMSLSFLAMATLVVEFDTKIILPPAGSVSCNLKCECKIQYSDKLYSAQRDSTHSWPLKGIINKKIILDKLKKATA